MLNRLRVLRRPLAAAVIIAAATAPLGSAPAGDDWDDADDFPAPAPAPVAQPPRFLINEDFFDQRLFGATRSARPALARLDWILALKIDEADRACGLTEAQRQKLRLAGRGDVKRLFDRIEGHRQAFHTARTDQIRFNAFLQELAPVQSLLQLGVFDDGSLFSKTVRTALDCEQKARYEEAVRASRLFRQRARVALVVSNLDHAAGLDSGQRRRLAELVERETRPPRVSGHFDYQFVLYQLAVLPEAKLRPLFNDGQWDLVNKQFEQARRFEPALTRYGYLPELAPAPGAKPGDPKPR